MKSFFAQHGYVFSDKDLDSYFRSFEWYIPNPNLKLNIKFTPETENFIEEIRHQEKI